ncbi:MAG: TlpA family protein disulfide reductase [Dehalococcoidia bacterium]|nr:TlpA family protein disulfide reductase [Dehalococcoidia bacterium]
MSKKTWLIRVILISAVIALVGTTLSCSSSSPSEAPDFTLPTLTGANITLSELEGTQVVLNFWATWCGPCRWELPYFESVAQQSAGVIKVIAINVGESASTVQNFFGDYEPTMIVALDSNRETFVNYCQNYGNLRGAIPFTLFVDSAGVIQYKKIGAFTSEAALWDTLHSVFGTTVP